MRNTSVNIIFQNFFEFYNLRYLKEIEKIKENIYSFSHSLDNFCPKKFIILPKFSGFCLRIFTLTKRDISRFEIRKIATKYQ